MVRIVKSGKVSKKKYLSTFLTVISLFIAFSYAYAFYAKYDFNNQANNPSSLCDCSNAIELYKDYSNNVFIRIGAQSHFFKKGFSHAERAGTTCVYNYILNTKNYSECSNFRDSCKNFLIINGVSQEDLNEIISIDFYYDEAMSASARLGELSRSSASSVSDLSESAKLQIELFEKISYFDSLPKNVFDYLKMNGCT